LDVLDVPHVDVDAAYVVHRGAGGVHCRRDVLADLAGLLLDVADPSDRPVRLARGYARDEDDATLGLDGRGLGEHVGRRTELLAADLLLRHATSFPAGDRRTGGGSSPPRWDAWRAAARAGRPLHRSVWPWRRGSRARPAPEAPSRGSPPERVGGRRPGAGEEWGRSGRPGERPARARRHAGPARRRPRGPRSDRGRWR